MPYHILLIDDDQDDRDFFLDAAAVVSNELIVTALQNGVNLISDLISGELQFPDLIFLDINVPEMDGWTCLSNLKENVDYAHIPVIMYSTSNYQEDAKRAKAGGALSFLSKPFDFKDLKEALNEVLKMLQTGNISNLPVNSKWFK